MSSMSSKVAEFHAQVLQVSPPPSPTLVSQEYCLERFRFMSEELDEFMTAAMTGEIVDAADALADIMYVALGTAHMMKLPIEAIFDHVHDCNMKKLLGTTKRGNKVDAVKPDGWVGPEQGIAKLIGDAIK